MRVPTQAVDPTTSRSRRAAPSGCGVDPKGAAREGEQAGRSASGRRGRQGRGSTRGLAETSRTSLLTSPASVRRSSSRLIARRRPTAPRVIAGPCARGLDYDSPLARAVRKREITDASSAVRPTFRHGSGLWGHLSKRPHSPHRRRPVDHPTQRAHRSWHGLLPLRLNVRRRTLFLRASDEPEKHPPYRCRRR